MSAGEECLFFPRSSPSFDSNAFVVPCEPGVELHCYLHKRTFRTSAAADRNQRTLVYFHGNGELVSGIIQKSDMPTLPNLIDAFHSLANHDVLLVEYRGYGASTGAPSIRSLIEDVKPIYQALGLPAEQLLVMGRSIGTIPALAFAAAFPGIRGLVIESGMSDPGGFITKRRAFLAEIDDEWVKNDGDREKELRKRDFEHDFTWFKPTLREFAGRLLLLHCADDEVFAEEEALRSFAWNLGVEDWAPDSCELCRAAKGGALTVKGADSDPDVTIYRNRRTTLAIFGAGGHNYIFPLNWKAYAGLLRSFVQEENEFSGEMEIGDTALRDGSWWPELQCWRSEQAKRRDNCVIC